MLSPIIVPSYISHFSIACTILLFNSQLTFHLEWNSCVLPLFSPTFFSSACFSAYYAIFLPPRTRSKHPFVALAMFPTNIAEIFYGIVNWFVVIVKIFPPSQLIISAFSIESVRGKTKTQSCAGLGKCAPTWKFSFFALVQKYYFPTSQQHGDEVIQCRNWTEIGSWEVDGVGTPTSITVLPSSSSGSREQG